MTHNLVTCVSMGCITSVAIVCLLRSCDLTVLVPVVAVVAGLGGYHLKK